MPRAFVLVPETSQSAGLTSAILECNRKMTCPTAQAPPGPGTARKASACAGICAASARRDGSCNRPAMSGRGFLPLFGQSLSGRERLPVESAEFQHLVEKPLGHREDVGAVLAHQVYQTRLSIRCIETSVSVFLQNCANFCGRCLLVFQ